MFEDDDLIMISALQHFLFCARQCALIHIEQQWRENVYTIQGELLHRRAHAAGSEKRRKSKREYGMPIRSLLFGLTGRTDAVEYSEGGGIVVVEYKRGRPKGDNIDEVQLCAQALCLEEMTGERITEGALYYGKQKRRKKVEFTEDLRNFTRNTITQLRAFLDKGITPSPVYSNKKCSRCSLNGICLPKKMTGSRSVDSYYNRMLKEDAGT
jgi:CRISPR-associated exonuclease Cas4